MHILVGKADLRHFLVLGDLAFGEFCLQLSRIKPSVDVDATGFVAGLEARVMAKNANDHYVDPATWLVQAAQKQGSWWPEWATWLHARSGEPIVPPNIGGVGVPLGEAPGSYVLQE